MAHVNFVSGAWTGCAAVVRTIHNLFFFHVTESGNKKMRNENVKKKFFLGFSRFFFIGKIFHLGEKTSISTLLYHFSFLFFSFSPFFLLLSFPFSSLFCCSSFLFPFKLTDQSYKYV